MSFLSHSEVQPTRLNGMRLTESVLGTTAPIIVGQHRTGWKLGWYGDFASQEQSSAGGGSGLGKSGAVGYTYSASVIGFICMGPCANLLSVWSAASGKFSCKSVTETFVIPSTPANPTYTVSQAAIFVGDAGVSFSQGYSITANDAFSPGSVTLTGNQPVNLALVSGVPGVNEYSLDPTTGTYTFNATNTTGTTSSGTVANIIEDGNGNITMVITGGPWKQGQNATFGTLTGATWLSGQTVAFSYANTSGHFTTVQFPDPTGIHPTPEVPFFPGVYFPVNCTGTVTSAASATSTGIATINYSVYTYLTIENELAVAAAFVPVEYQSVYKNDNGVNFYPSGVALTSVNVPQASLTTGQYNPNGGNYLFATADFNLEVVINYTYYIQGNSSNAPQTLNLTFFNGTQSQAPWAYLTSKHPNYALGYTELAYAACLSMYLGQTPSLPQLNFEVAGVFQWGGNIVDANPADMIYGLCTNPRYKLYFPTQYIDSSLLIGNSSARNYWAANNFFISCVLDGQSSLMSIFSDICEAGNTYQSWDEGRWKFIPLGDTSAVANGCTFTPPTGNAANVTLPVVDLDDNDFLPAGKNKDPITFDQTPWESRWNRVGIRWSVRVNDYNEDVLPQDDSAAIQAVGLMAEPAKDYQFITTQVAAQWTALLRLGRFQNIYTTWKFSLKKNFCFLSPGDIVTVTDGLLGTSGYTTTGRTPVRLTKMTDPFPEKGKGIECEAENFPWSVGNAILVNQQAALPSNTNEFQQQSPGDTTAVIFQIPNRANLYEGDTIFIYANGANANWGGWNLYVSNDGVAYNFFQQVPLAGKIGQLTTLLPATPDPDISDTLSVDMTVSGATLGSVSASDWANNVTLSALIGPGGTYSPQVLATTGMNLGSSGPGDTGFILCTHGGQAAVVVGANTWAAPNNLTSLVSYTTGGVTGTKPNLNTLAGTFYPTIDDELPPSGIGAIVGIEVTVQAYISAYSSAGTCNLNANVSLGLFSPQGTPKSVLSVTSTTSPTVYTLGGPTDLWGLSSLTQADISSGTFSVTFSGGQSATGVGHSSTFDVNSLYIKIYYAGGGQGAPWVDPQYITQGVSYSSSTLTSTEVSTIYLGAGGFDFNLPFGNVIDGIQVDVESYSSSSSGAELSAILVYQGQPLSAPKGFALTNSNANYTFGGPTDPWAVSNLSLDIVNDPSFGVAFFVNDTNASATEYLRNGRITVYGTAAYTLELISYETVALTGVNTYGITNLHRGIYGSYVAEFPIGSYFVRMDNSGLKYSVNPTFRGQNLWFKTASYNAFGQQAQAPSSIAGVETPILDIIQGAIDTGSGSLTTGTVNQAVTAIDPVVAAAHGTFGISQIPEGYVWTGPVGGGVAQWLPGSTGGTGSGATGPTGPTGAGLPGPTGATGAYSAATTSSPTGSSYTAQLSDNGNVVEMGYTGATAGFVIPENGSVAFPVGATLTVVQEGPTGAAGVVVSGATGVTLQTSSSYTTRAQYSIVGLLQTSIDTWLLLGDLA